MNTRTSLAERLKLQIENDPNKMHKCIQDSRNAISRDFTNRALDEIPSLLDQEEFLSLKVDFEKTLYHPTKLTVHQFENRIASIGCKELLDINGHIKKEIIELLGWKDLDSKIDNYNIVCAFVGAVNSSLFIESSSLIQNNSKAYSAMLDYVNQNYGKWVLETMRKLKISYDEKYNSDHITMTDIVSYPIKHPLLLLSFFVAGIPGIAVYAGAKQLKNVYDENANLSQTNIPKL